MLDSKGIQRKIFDLTLALYRVTDFFPQGEALRRHLREKAGDILGRVTEYGFSEEKEREALGVLAKLESIKGYLGIAKSLRFVKPINIAILEREYESLTELFAKEAENGPQETRSTKSIKKEDVVATTEASILQTKPEPKEPEAKVLPTWGEFTSPGEGEKMGREVLGRQAVVTVINDRQRKILEYIKGVNQAKISDFFSVFGDISSKTIQRDLQDLVAREMLKKEGEKRWTIYSIKVG